MFTFSSNTLAGSYSMRPKRDNPNNDYTNISINSIEPDNSILSIDVNSINFENASVELALNVLQLQHVKYHEMTQQDVIMYYNDRMKMNNDINKILALKIILKNKLKGVGLPINKQANTNNLPQNTPTSNKVSLSENYHTPVNKLYNKEYNVDKNSNNFKIVQNNPTNQSSNGNGYALNHLNTRTGQNNATIMPNLNINLNNTNQIVDLYHNLGRNNNYTPKQTSTINNFSSKQIPISNNTQPQNTQETFGGRVISSSNEFDIDSIINLYSQKKSSGMIK